MHNLPPTGVSGTGGRIGYRNITPKANTVAINNTRGQRCRKSSSSFEVIHQLLLGDVASNMSAAH